MVARSQSARWIAPAGTVRPGPVLCCALLALACLLAAPRDSGAAGKKGEFGLGVQFGGGSYDNDDFNADLERIGYGRIESGIEYGFSADYRASRWLSLTFNASRIGGESTPPTGAGDPSTTATYAVRASPLAFGAEFHPLNAKHLNVDLFAAGGPLLNATVSASSGIYEFEGKKTGVFWQGGALAEYRFSTMVAFTLTGLARHAVAKNVDLSASTGDPTAKWDLEFNGFAMWFGPRLYFGTSEP
jgi:hypothetical protein